MKQTSDRKPNTPQKYGHARRVIPIRRRIRQRVLIRWLVILAIGAAFALLCCISAPRFRSPRDLQISIGLTILIYLFIIWQSHILKLTFSHGWTGKIVGKEVKKYTKIPQGLASFGADAHSKRMGVLDTACFWTVETDDGYVETVHYDTDEIWEGYFSIGERVRFYKNAKILVKAHPEKDDENLMCPLCGVMVMEPVCKKCGVDFHEKEEQ